MRSMPTTMFSAALLALVSIGCEPRPVVAPETDPAVDVNVNREGVRIDRDHDGKEDGAAVDVQVGGGQGVQVEVERDGQ